jgi:hypothetical protein
VTYVHRYSARCMLHVQQCMPHVARCTLHAACRTLHVARCMPHVARCICRTLHVAYAARCTLHVARRTSRWHSGGMPHAVSRIPRHVVHTARFAPCARCTLHPCMRLRVEQSGSRVSHLRRVREQAALCIRTSDRPASRGRRAGKPGNNESNPKARSKPMPPELSRRKLTGATGAAGGGGARRRRKPDWGPLGGIPARARPHWWKSSDCERTDQR